MTATVNTPNGEHHYEQANESDLEFIAFICMMHPDWTSYVLTVTRKVKCV